MSELYNSTYYKQYCGPIPYTDEHFPKFFSMIADHIVEDLNPTTVLDAGCAMGYLVAALRDRGVEAWGIDISSYAIENVREDIRPYCFTGSLTAPLPEGMPSRYDLVVTIEVLEHLYAEDGELAIQNLCSLSDHIIFSSSSEDFTEQTHVNVQQREYWAKLFLKQEFFDDLNYRPTYITSWAMYFRHDITWIRQVENYEHFIRLAEADSKKQKQEYEGLFNQFRDMNIAKDQAERDRERAEQDREQAEYGREQAEHDREQAEHDCRIAQAAFLDISNSRIWRLTKPLRGFLDWLLGRK